MQLGNGLMHDLVAPLNGIIGMSDVLLERYFGALTERQEGFVRDIRQSGARLLDLLRGHLDRPGERTDVERRPTPETVAGRTPAPAADGRRRAPRVLLVDDQPSNRRVLEGLLAPLDCEVRHAGGGADALAQVETWLPDLVLLDVVMPGLTGIEVCERLKAGLSTRSLPVLLLTSLADRESRIAGLEAGADDFLTRPVDPTELRTRVQSLLKAKALRDELEERYEELRRLEESREGLVQMMVHDLRNPLVSVIGHLELMESGGRDGEARGHDACRRGIPIARRGAERVVSMVTDILDVARLESGRLPLSLALVDVRALLVDVLAESDAVAARKDVSLDLAAGHGPAFAWADPSLLRRVLGNVVSNAVAFSPRGTRVVASTGSIGSGLRVSVTDAGPGIPARDRERIFEKYGALPAAGRKYSTGLGLAFCKLAVEALGGSIGVESVPSESRGSTFWIVLPEERT